jgi:acetylglutamate kinase
MNNHARKSMHKVMTFEDMKLLKESRVKELEYMKYIEEFKDKTIVVKYGGSALETTEKISYLIDDLIFLKQVGINVVLLHGGSRQLNNKLKGKNIKSDTIDGIRVTTKEILTYAIEVFREVNDFIVDEINKKGNGAIKGFGLNGNEIPLTISEFLDKNKYQYVGRIVKVNVDYIKALSKPYIPVLSSLSQTKDHEPLNVNADTYASEIAKKLNAYKFVIMTDTDGIIDEHGKLLSSLDQASVRLLLEKGIISAGMIPKVEACLSALEGNINKVHIINGTAPHALAKEILTDSGIGTEIVKHSKVKAMKHA